MPLTKSQIQAEGLILSDRPEGYRAAGYDLAIEAILIAPPSGEGSASSDIRECREAYRLSSAGMVKVISREIVSLPNNIVGYALVKNSMSNKGVLAINIGVIDPGYNGPISSTLINFGPDPLILMPGEPFLRLSFHRIEESCNAAKGVSYTKEKYLEMAKTDILRSGSDKFLNLSQLSEELIRNGLERLKKWSLAGLAIAATILGIVALLVPLYAAYWTMTVEAVRRWLVPIIDGI